MLTAEKRREILAEALPVLARIETRLEEATQEHLEVELNNLSVPVGEFIRNIYLAAGFSVQLGCRLSLEWKYPRPSGTTLVKPAEERFLQTSMGLSEEIKEIDQMIETEILQGKSSISVTVTPYAQDVLRAQGYTVVGDEISW